MKMMSFAYSKGRLEMRPSFESGRLRLLAAGSSVDSNALQSAMDDAFLEMKAQLKIRRSEVTGR